MNTKIAFTRLSIVLVCAVGLAFSGCSFNFNMVDGYVFTKTGETAESIEEGEISEGISAIEVINKFGNVKVELADGKPGWKWDSKVWADSQELADVLIDELMMSVQTSGQTQTWEVILPMPSSDLNGIQSNLTLMLPPELKAKVQNGHGDVSVANLSKTLDLKNGHGNVVVMKVQGKAKITNSHGDVTASQIGEATFDVNHGATEVKSANGNVSISSSHGDIHVENIAGELKIDGSHTDVQVDQVEANQEIEIKTSHADIVATNLSGDVDARNSHGSTKISTSGKRVSVESSHGKIELTMLSNDFKSIDLEASYDSIKVYLPDGSKPYFDMETSHGDTNSEIGSDESSQQTVKLRNRHGDIRVMQSEVVVAEMIEQ